MSWITGLLPEDIKRALAGDKYDKLLTLLDEQRTAATSDINLANTQALKALGYEASERYGSGGMSNPIMAGRVGEQTAATQRVLRDIGLDFTTKKLEIEGARDEAADKTVNDILGGLGTVAGVALPFLAPGIAPAMLGTKAGTGLLGQLKASQVLSGLGKGALTTLGGGGDTGIAELAGSMSLWGGMHDQPEDPYEKMIMAYLERILGGGQRMPTGPYYRDLIPSR